MSAKVSVQNASPITEFPGKVSKLPPQVQIELESGTRLVAPGDSSFSIGIIDDIDKGLDILCRVFGIGCPKPPPGGGGSGGSGGCYTIITPDGTTITICPPKTVIA